MLFHIMGLFKGIFRKKKKSNSTASAKESSSETATTSATKIGSSKIRRTVLEPDTSSITRTGTPEQRQDQPVKNDGSSQNYHFTDTLNRVTTEEPSNTNAASGVVEKLYQPRYHPSAREAAFHGPPKFDWVDIETAAAIKVQAAYRRHVVMERMEAEGVRTSAIRNRRRRKKAAIRKQEQGYGALVSSEDAPSMLACCAVGLAFGDATEEDDKAYRDFQKKQYENRVKQQAAHEEALRTRYLQSHGAGVGRVEEIIEIVK